MRKNILFQCLFSCLSFKSIHLNACEISGLMYGKALLLPYLFITQSDAHLTHLRNIDSYIELTSPSCG